MPKPKKQKIEVVGTVITVSYPTIRKSLSRDVSKFEDAVKFEAMIHGFKQKYGDVESGGSPAEKFAMLTRVMESHDAGSWDLTTKADDGAIVIEAVTRIKGLEVEEVRAVVEKAGEAGPEKLKEWRTNAKVKAEIAKIRAERAAAAAEEAEDEDEIEL